LPDISSNRPGGGGVIGQGPWPLKKKRQTVRGEKKGASKAEGMEKDMQRNRKRNKKTARGKVRKGRRAHIKKVEARNYSAKKMLKETKIKFKKKKI